MTTGMHRIPDNQDRLPAALDHYIKPAEAATTTSIATCGGQENLPTEGQTIESS